MESIILTTTKDYVLVCKPAGFLSEKAENAPSCPDEIEKILGKTPYVVHRLDRNTEGLMVYALTKQAAAEFSRIIADGKLKKCYRALVTPDEELPEEGEMRDYLYFDRRRDKSFVVGGERKGAKLAVLRYRLGEKTEIKGKPVRAAYIELETGRTHQIRVQFGSRKSPLAGDGKYGSRINYSGVSLTAVKLSFPWGGKEVVHSLSDFA